MKDCVSNSAFLWDWDIMVEKETISTQYIPTLHYNSIELHLKMQAVKLFKK